MPDLNILVTYVKVWFQSPRNNLVFGFFLGLAATLLVGYIV